MLVGTLKPHFTKWCNRNHTSHKCWWIRTHWNLFPDATVSTSDCAKACPWANIQVIIQCQPDSVIISSLSPWSWGPNGQSVPFICTVPTPKIQIWILSLEEKNLFIQISFFCIFTFRPRNSKTFTSCLWWMLRCHKASGSPPDINQSFANDQKTLKVDAPGEIKIPTQVEAAQTHCFLKWKLCCLAINVLTHPKKINKSTSSVGFWVL